MAIENLTTYTEQDAGGFITESTTKVTITAMTSQTDCYLYKDFSANYFDALDIDYEIYVQNEEANKYGHAGIAVTNTLNDMTGFADTDISVTCSTRGSNVLWFRLSRGNFTETDYDALSTDTLYYCTLSRSAGSGTVVNHVYSDSARTTEVATQTITGLTAATKWRYNFGAVNCNLGVANRLSTGYIQNINLNYITPVLTVTTQAASSVEATTATGNGNITVLGVGGNATIRGIQWDIHTHSGGAYANDIHEHGDYGAGAFTIALTSLPTGTTIYARAYATSPDGTSYGDEITFLTKPAAPTNVSATDGSETSKVVITWTKSTGATGYIVYRGAVNASGTLGDVATYDDTGADASVITPGTASATDGTYSNKVTLSLAGESVANGTTHTYKVVAVNATGNSADSSTDTGYRGHGSLTLQWQVSAADSDVSFGNIAGATTDPYDYTSAPSGGDGRYYLCVVSATGAVNANSTHDRGYTTPPPNFPSAGSMKVQIAFVNTPLEESPTWVDIVNDVREIHTSRGRNHELDRMESGTCDLVLTNTSGDYWPDNTGGTYTPNVNIMKKIYIKVYYNGWHDVFTGYIESYNPSFLGAGGYGSLMTLHCVGIIGKILSLQVLNNAGYSSEASGTRVHNVLTSCGIPDAWIVHDVGSDTLIATGANVNVNALSHLQKVQETELSLFYELPSGILLYEGRGHRNTAPHLTSQATFGLGGGSEIPYSDFAYVKDEVLLFNDVRITRVSGTEQVATHTTSQSNYGKRSYVKTGTLHTTDSMAFYMANLVLGRYALPYGRAESLTIIPDSVAKWTQIFTREISDRITFKNTAAGINKDYFIESVSHDWDFTNLTFSTQWSLSDATQYISPPDAITETLMPNAAGNVTGLTPLSGTNWSCVCTNPPNDALYVYRNAGNSYDLYNIASSSYMVGTINSVSVTVRALSAGNGNLSTKLITHSTEYTGGNTPLTGSFAYYTTTYTTNPNTGLAWTWAEITDLQIGEYLATDNQAKCSQAKCTVNFTPTW